MIEYRIVRDWNLNELIDLYKDTSLGERRPVDDRKRFAAMFRNASLIIGAWDEQLLVGLARSLTDFSHVTYLADLLVRNSYQRRGIGRELVRLTQEYVGPTSILLLAAPEARDYYRRLGFVASDRAWFLPAGQSVV
ncbi:MAG TPA: GNAT family N-acetyltransferase [Acidobacteriota bacterium]|nr:GNAT family N-acetyltransferase [Acidobacteriota bacterium]